MRGLFGRHAREFSRALTHGEFVSTDDGLLLPKQGALLSGRISVRLDGDHVVTQPNRICDEGAALLGVGAGALVYPSGFANLAGLYIAPWGNNVTPDSAWEAANGINDWTMYHLLGELGDPDPYTTTEGYTESGLQVWTPSDAGSGLIDNSGAPATINMVTGSTITIRGFTLINPILGTNKQLGRPYASGGDPGGGVADFALVDVTGQTNDTPDTTTVTRYGTQYQWASPFTNSITGTDCNGWLDVDGDTSFDVGLAHWIGGANAVTLAVPTGSPALAISKLGSPLSCTNGQVVNITWGIQLE
jgi:hypothetical protein